MTSVQNSLFTCLIVKQSPYHLMPVLLEYNVFHSAVVITAKRVYTMFVCLFCFSLSTEEIAMWWIWSLSVSQFYLCSTPERKIYFFSS